MRTQSILSVVLAVILTGCAACESRSPVTPSGGTGGASSGAGGAPLEVAGTGGSLLGGSGPALLSPCTRACLNLDKMHCSQGLPVDGLSCQQLCEQTLQLQQAAECVASATNCNDADNCPSAL